MLCSSVVGCGTLDDKTILIDAGSSKADVLNILGTPEDRQFKGTNEAWQYCVSGAGFGYNDHKIVWFLNGVVTGITSYRSRVTGCSSAIKSINWEEAPDIVIEHRAR